jgi:hypothetical protein
MFSKAHVRSIVAPRDALVCVMLATVLGCRDGRDATRDPVAITMSDSVTITSSGDSVDLQPRVPAISRSGHIAAYREDQPSGGVAVFSASGEFLQLVGQQGGGPGEFREVSAVGFGAADTLWIVDGLFAAHAYAPPPSLAYVRSVKAEEPMIGEPTRDGILSAGYVRYGKGVMPPALRRWPDLLSVRFGREHAIEEADALLGVVAPIDSAHIWAARGNAYRIELLSRDGRVVQTIQREVPWFTSEPALPGAPWSAPPRARVAAISSDDHRRLWVLVRRAHRNWAPVTPRGVDANRPVPIRNMPSFAESSRLFGGVIEVFDVKSGALLASRDASGAFLGFPSAGYVSEIVEMKNGLVTIRIWKLGTAPAPTR